MNDIWKSLTFCEGIWEQYENGWKPFETILKQYGNSWKSFTILVVAAYSIQFTLTAYALGAFEYAADNVSLACENAAAAAYTCALGNRQKSIHLKWNQS